MRPLRMIVMLGGATLAACGGGGGNDDQPAIDARPSGVDAVPAPYCQPTNGTSMKLTRIVGGLSHPVGATAPSGDSRIFVIERPGYVRVIRNGLLEPTPYIDLTDRILSVGDEQGLLGIAFHPNFAENRKVYLSYSRDSDEHRVISEFTAASVDANTLDPATERILIHDPHVARDNHNGGAIAFDPEGFLYITLGDGGGANDSEHGGQNTTTLRAKILRIDVDRGDPYAVPPDNPWATAGGVPEMWAWGLRNPWQISIDSHGNIFIGDVGQEDYEEIDIIPAGMGGLNFGWPVFEGSTCFTDDENGDEGCDNPGAYAMPAYSLDRRGMSGSIIGGRLYEGTCMPQLRGTYIFGDYNSGRIFASPFSGGGLPDVQDRTAEIDPNHDVEYDLSAFGTDGYGELYVMALNGGELFRFEIR
jgi:glucose/arabinose dehydrogenase